MHSGRIYEDYELDVHLVTLRRSLTLMEKRLTLNRYLCGDEPSIADLSAACELDSVRYIELDLGNFPKTKAWLYHMVDENTTIYELNLPSRQFASKLV